MLELVVLAALVEEVLLRLHFLVHRRSQDFGELLADLLGQSALVHLVQLLQLLVALLDQFRDLLSFLHLRLQQLFRVVERVLRGQASTSAWLMRPDKKVISSDLSVGA